MSFCPQCGVQNPDAARFCDQCGAALVPTSGVAVPTSAPSIPSAPSSYTAPTVLSTAPVAAPASGALICAQCGATALPGEAFCDNCGAPLNAPARPAASVPAPSYNPGVPAQPTYPPPQPAASPAFSVPPAASPAFNVPPTAAAPAASPASPVAVAPVPAAPVAPAPARVTLAPARLVIAATGAAVPLPLAANVVIGRADPVSKFSPDIDLTPYSALEQGVGRRHARLAVQAGQITIEDLDSTNGTSINGNKLSPRQPTVLHSGDTVHLGRIAVRIQE